MNNYFDLCAVYLLEFETIMKERDISSKPLKKLIEEQQAKISEQNKIKQNINENGLNRQIKSKEVGPRVINRAVEKNVKHISNKLNAAIPENKVNLIEIFINIF
jgi:DNA-binding protein H-NS